MANKIKMFQLGTRQRCTKTLEEQAAKYSANEVTIEVSIVTAQILPDIELAYNLIDSNPTQAKTILQDVIDYLNALPS